LLAPGAFLDSIDVEPGAVTAALGAGPGFHWPLAHGTGPHRTVYAVEYTGRTDGDALAPNPTAADNAAEYFCRTNLALGAVGLFGPTVTDRDDGLMNVHPGTLLGITAINWAHDLLHAGWGVYGLTARGSHEQSVRYMRATTGVFGATAAMGYNKLRGREGTYMAIRMAMDQIRNYIHAAGTGIGLAYSLDPHLGEERQALQAGA
jgi:hypothetical protein